MQLYRSVFAAVAIATTASAAAIASLAKRTPGDCFTGPGAPIQWVGGDSGNDWCESHWNSDYAPITGLEVWRTGDKNGDHVAGIQFIYATGIRSDTFGRQDTSRFPSQTLSLQPDELITSAILYGNGKGAYLGHIHIETNKGTQFDAGRDTSGIGPWQVDVGSGILLGAFGRSGSVEGGPGDNDIISMAFLFLREPVDHIEVKDVSYDTSQLENQGEINPQVVNVGTYYNAANTNVTVGQTQTFTVAKAREFSQSTTEKFGLSHNIEFSAELLGVGAKSATTFNWEQTQQSTNSMTETDTTSLACTFSASLAPNRGIAATGTFANATVSVPYTSNVYVYLTDGYVYSYAENGQLSAAGYYACNTVTEENDDPGLPNTATVLGGGAAPPPPPPPQDGTTTTLPPGDGTTTAPSQGDSTALPQGPDTATLHGISTAVPQSTNTAIP